MRPVSRQLAIAVLDHTQFSTIAIDIKARELYLMFQPYLGTARVPSSIEVPPLV
jgi:hypothetical protein